MALFVSLLSYLLSLFSHDSRHYYLIVCVTIVSLFESQLSHNSVVLRHCCGLFQKQWFVNTSLAQVSLNLVYSSVFFILVSFCTYGLKAEVNIQCMLDSASSLHWSFDIKGSFLSLFSQ